MQDTQMADQTTALLAVNNLQYALKPDLSTVVSRTTLTQYFALQAYSPNSSMICIFNTGSAFVGESYLSLDVKNTSTASISFGTGSACNLINRVTISSRSGSVLERVDDSATLSYILQYASFSQAELASKAVRMGKGVILASGTTARVIIPMSVLSGLFSVNYLLPSCLMSGLRIQLDLNPSVGAVVYTDASPPSVAPSYQITGCYINATAYQLTDSVTRQINEMAASGGLEVVFPTYHCTQGSKSAEKFNNIECRKAVSRALAAVFRQKSVLSSTDYVNDAFKLALSPTSGPVSVQFHCGSLYMPAQPLSHTSPAVLSFETANQLQEVFRKGDIVQDNYNTLNPALGCTLERDGTIDLSGIPLSNSRVLALQLTTADSVSTTWSFFLSHVVLARCFLNNVSVEV